MEVHHFFRRSSFYVYGLLLHHSKLSSSFTFRRSKSKKVAPVEAVDQGGGRKLRRTCQEVLNFLELKYERFYEKQLWSSVKAELIKPSRTYACFLNEFSHDVTAEHDR